MFSEYKKKAPSLLIELKHNNSILRSFLRLIYQQNHTCPPFNINHSVPMSVKTSSQILPTSLCFKIK